MQWNYSSYNSVIRIIRISPSGVLKKNIFTTFFRSVYERGRKKDRNLVKFFLSLFV